MSNAADRSELCEAILSFIELKRAQTGDPFLGAPIERVVLEAQFRAVEQDILENPGAIEPWFIRRRRAEA
jgi:hypothetical protein